MADKKEKKYVIDNKELMEEWDWEKNNELGLAPNSLTCGSGKKVWWTCSKGHEWQASIGHRSNGRGCPYCANRKVLAGFNDLQTTHPQLAKEWDYEKNYPLIPTEITAGSHLKVWWTCPQGHPSYEMVVLYRCQGNNCPVCSGKRIVIGVNDLFTMCPEFEKEWDWDKNNKLLIFPTELTKGTNKKVYWKCKVCGHEWEASPNARTGHSKTGCPCCAGKVVVKGINDLQTLFPEIAKKWHPTKNNKKPDEVTAFSNQEVWWVCDKDSRHVFKARINHLTKGEIVCSFCSNQKIIIGGNDLQTTNPELMQEWNWVKNNELGIFPTEVTKGANKKAWWICKICGHEWCANIGSRTGEQHCGCPKCKSDFRSSFPEKAISFYLSKFFTVEENKKFSWLGNSELDIYVSELNLGIEYDGEVWHKNLGRDKNKDKLCKKNGITLIRVREKSCPIYESSSIKIERKGDRLTDLKICIEDVLGKVSQISNRKIVCEVNIDNDYLEILEKISTSKKEKSIANSELIKSWNYEKNGKLSPENISLGSDKKVWWKCSKGHEWQATVSSRSGKQKCGCPVCAGQKVVAGENDLQTLFPNIAREWDYNKNIEQPNQIRPMSNKKFWWVCLKCGKSYLSSPSHRIGRNSACPFCARLKTISSHFKKIKNIDTGEIFESIKDASNKLHINAGSISNCCRNVGKTAGGYHWEFVKD